MPDYKTFLALEQSQVHLVDEFQQRIKKKKNVKTLSNRWAFPLDRDLLASLIYRKMLHVATTMDQKTVIGYVAGLSRFQIPPKLQSVTDTICKNIDDNTPLFTSVIISPDCHQESVFYSLADQCYKEVAMRDYYSKIITLEQSNKYLNEFLRSVPFGVEEPIFTESFTPPINVFVRYIA